MPKIKIGKIIKSHYKTFYVLENENALSANLKKLRKNLVNRKKVIKAHNL